MYPKQSLNTNKQDEALGFQRGKDNLLELPVPISTLVLYYCVSVYVGYFFFTLSSLACTAIKSTDLEKTDLGLSVGSSCTVYVTLGRLSHFSTFKFVKPV